MLGADQQLAALMEFQHLVDDRLQLDLRDLADGADDGAQVVLVVDDDGDVPDVVHLAEADRRDVADVAAHLGNGRDQLG